MNSLTDLLEKNRAWSDRINEEDPEFFARLSKQQNPDYLWIGCSDSRVPANQIIDMAPGEVFVHRNVANVVVHTDLNCLSTIQFAVDVLKVRHILVVGHYGCGGVLASLTQARLGLVDNWIRHVTDVADKHERCLHDVSTLPLQHARLCELNVLEQVVHVVRTTVVQDAWNRGQELTVHGWVYSLRDGLVHDLGLDVSANEQLDARYAAALAKIQVDRQER
ncbi:carbonate dehydratase [Stenotrophomonas sp. HITSZ_GD]|uniref:carbonate dehydratase n=1 Tax=Stenotrophomonas sp. HITSZ_GD TaxID=3037248 RepID=UPI00240D784D|nr:carbonate dehydratase [Stenotrophomonas sp. HITSZ_GD]MDG2526644.1 carbonate dehydratase [Stenotrophomonas sp. HITSZ_GD]